MRDSTRRADDAELEETAERARELARGAADLRDVAEREAAHADDRVDADYGFRVPGAIRHADAVRAGDDLATAERQERVATAQGTAAEALQRNAEQIRETGKQIRQMRELMRETARDVNGTAADVQDSQADTLQVHEDVHATPPELDDDEA